MKVTKQLLDNIPINNQETIINKMNTFEKLILDSPVLKDIPKGFWIRNIKGTDIYKFRVNIGDRILFKFLNENKKNGVLFIDYCKHDKQISTAKNYNNGGQVLDLDINKKEYIEDEFDYEINKKVNSDMYLKIKELEDLVIDDEYISLSIEENDKREKKYLSKQQYECLCNIIRPMIVFGCAGSGKSMIAIRKLLLNNELNTRTAYITCSKNIVEDVADFYYKYGGSKENAYFYTLRDLCKSIIGLNQEAVVINYYDFKLWLEDYTNFLVKNDYLRTKEIWIEINTIIKTNGNIISRNEYLDYYDSKYSDKEKVKVYEIAVEYDKWLKTNNFYDDNDLAYSAMNSINDKMKFDFIIYDEVQELTRIQMELLFKLVKDINNILLLGDLNQNVNTKKFDLSFLKNKLLYYNNTELEEKFINKNYRNVSSVVEWINKFLEIKNSKFKSIEKKYQEPELYLRKGSKPKIIHNMKEEENFFEQINNDTNSIIIVGEEQDKKDIESRGYPIGRVFTIEDVRGLEYKNVYCYKIMSKYEYIWSKIMNSELKVNNTYKIYFNMLYIAVTRSRDNICFIEDKITEIEKMLYELWDKNVSVQDLLQQINYIYDKDKWLKEAKRLERTQNYYQAAEAYKKAGMLHESQLCLKALDRKISFINNEEKYSYIVIQADKINKEYINLCLEELQDKYNLAFYGYIDIRVWYSENKGGASERKFIYDKNNLKEVSDKLFQVLDKQYISKKQLAVKGYFYEYNVSKDSDLKNKLTFDIAFECSEGKIKSYITNFFQLRMIDKMNENIKADTIKKMGYDPNADQLRILRNKEKYEKKTADDILEFIFKQK